MEQKELDRILELHKKWLNNEEDGEKLNLSGANLRGLNFAGLNLKYADFIYADLTDSDLSNTNLHGACFRSANLSNTNLRNAILNCAYLYHANLNNTNLDTASLRNSELSNAKIINANLRGADLTNAYLKDVKISDVKTDYLTTGLELACPEEGSFIAWKKVSTYCERYLVKLLIPENAKRSSATTSKCRCEFAKVLEITNIATGESVESVVNSDFVKCVYKVGEMVYPDSYDEDRWNECSHGIHFFMSKNNALNY